ncbi:receptor-like protein kinase HSL1 isoform X1 [Juglans microcarpa x Juglans regia]|uniref:receptor-like protein kinase HSL1 isoform X1 n=1 Tax=Juglans microcarpa x Juglans regia TaxID=2249226 RepID=UPI001B7F4967|nr:receptor-like protein kinase HSL1 isoform X1 [Juglans microcarpa x Juglans regia]
MFRLPFVVVGLLLFVSSPLTLCLNQDGLFLQQVKGSLSDPTHSLSHWNDRDDTPCNWTGIACDPVTLRVTSVNLSSLQLAGPFPIFLCRLPSLIFLSLPDNFIGSFLTPNISSCQSLQYLDLAENLLVGPIPDTLSQIPNLRHLNLSSNNFSGGIPASFGEFRRLETLNLASNFINGSIPTSLGNISSLKELSLAYNPLLQSPLPSELGNLTSLELIWLRACDLVGKIPASIGRLTRLTNLDLSKNRLTGSIPSSITGLKSIVQIELYENSLSGELPSGMSNLTNLLRIDVSVNNIMGTIPEDLCGLPLESFNLNENRIEGSLPESITRSVNLYELKLFNNKLSGSLPSQLGKNSPLRILDLSYNGFSGEIPSHLCDTGALEDLILIANSFSGKIPESLGNCQNLSRVRLKHNELSGTVPEKLWGLPHVYLLELEENSLSGDISTMISGAHNLSQLKISSNSFSGLIPEEIGSLGNLIEFSGSNNMLTGQIPGSLVKLSELGKLDLSDNELSGEIPVGIQAWKKLNDLNLANNRLYGEIPSEIGGLQVLNYLDLSGNRFSGKIPLELQNLKLSLLNLSNNRLSGSLPPVYNHENYRSSFVGNPGLCGDLPDLCPGIGRSKKRVDFWVLGLIFGLAAIVLVVGVVWFYWKYRTFKKNKRGIAMSKWRSFHKLSFSEIEILDCLREDNVIGSGASGKVYKVVLSNGDVAAVKKLWGGTKKEYGTVDSEKDEFKAEVETLGRIRHKNIVRLWCCYDTGDCKLLVYEYMPNGSLGDVLRSRKAGLLDWPTRYRIALDAAEGLSYLHHDCVPPIVHRDVKSNNILLDGEFRARVADFGVAKAVVTVSKGEEAMSVIAGSCGYIAPEYAYTLRVNEKSDIYSFGVVILELVTGRLPTDPEFGERDLVKWVCTTLDGKGVDHVIDSNLDSKYKAEIGKVLDIGLMCAGILPINRPSMRKVVKFLQEAVAENKTKIAKKDGMLSPYYYEEASEQRAGKEQIAADEREMEREISA